MTTFDIFHTIRVMIGVRDAPHLWGAGEIRDAGEQRLFGGLFVTPHIWGTGEMSTEISATYLGRWGNKHWKSRRIYVALGHDELNMGKHNVNYTAYLNCLLIWYYIETLFIKTIYMKSHRFHPKTSLISLIHTHWMSIKYINHSERVMPAS